MLNHKKKKPIAIGGIGGSGTRIVAQILETLGIFIGDDLNPAHDNLIFTFLFKRKSLYSKKQEDFEKHYAIFEKYMTNQADFSVDEIDFIKSLEIPIEIKDKGKERWSIERTEKLLNNKSKNKDNRDWGWKEPNTHIFLDRLYSVCPDLKYIHVVRNGLDMSLSSNKNQLKNWGSYFLDHDFTITPYHALKFWLRAQERVENITTQQSKDYFLLSFDKLCEKPREIIVKLLEYLDFNISENQVDELCNFVEKPESSGRYKTIHPSSFDYQDIYRVSELGFDVDDDWLNQLKDTIELNSINRSIQSLNDVTITPNIPRHKSKSKTEILGGVYDNEGRIITKAKRQAVQVSTSNKYLDNINPNKELKQIDGIFLYLGQYTTEYGHFLLETLSRFWALDQNLEYDKIIFHPLRSRPSTNLMDFEAAHVAFSCFNVNPNDIIITDKIQRYKTVLVPSSLITLNEQAHNSAKVIYEKIVSYCQNKSSNKYPLKIYLSRRKLAKNDRPVNNEKEIEDLFKSHGFSTIYPETLSFIDQVNLYSKVEIIAGFSGSAMHNVLFCNHKATTIIIGHLREPKAPHRNQIICNNLSEATPLFIPFEGRVLDLNKELVEFDLSKLNLALENIMKNKSTNTFYQKNTQRLGKIKKSVVCVLGMHRSGTSSLAGSLQSAGLYAGKIAKKANMSQPKGNRENREAIFLNDQVLKHSSANWHQVPTSLTWNDYLAKERNRFINEMNRQSDSWMFKDPRTLLTFPFWREALPDLILIGTFRHPMSVALSLYQRQPLLMPLKKGLELWIEYNERLLNLAKHNQFQLLCFDLKGELYLNQLSEALSILNKQIDSNIILSQSEAISFYQNEAISNNNFRAEMTEEHSELINRAQRIYDELFELSGAAKYKLHNKDDSIIRIPIDNTVEALNNTLKKHPDNLLLNIMLATKYEELGDDLQSLKTLQKVLALDPKQSNIIEKIGIKLINLKRHKEGIEVLEQLLDNNPERVHIYILIAKSKVKINDTNKALELCNTARELAKSKVSNNQKRFSGINRQIASVYLLCAHDLYKKGKLDQCIKVCEQAVALSPKQPNPRVLVCLARCYQSKSMTEQAMIHFKRALFLDPDLNVNVYLLLANLYEKTNQSKNAIDLYLKAKEKYPDHKTILNRIAKLED